MKKIMFSERYGLHNLVLAGAKTQTRRISEKPAYEVGEVVAVAQRYCDIEGMQKARWRATRGWSNKMYVKAEHMPYRIKITDVRQEHLQGISDIDCMKEGIRHWLTLEGKSNGYYLRDTEKNEWFTYPAPRETYARLIDSLSGKGTWDSNPKVWVYDFELCV